MNIVDRIKTKCTENGTTIKALEREIGLGNGTITRWNTNIPSYDKVIKVADFLQTSFYWLIFGKEAGDLTPEEKKLVDCYRTADERGKRTILRTAEQESAEPESSGSRTG